MKNGHTIPALDTLERYSKALDIPLHELFYSGDETPSTPNLTPRKTLKELAATQGKASVDARFLIELRTYLNHLLKSDREKVLNLAKKLAVR